MKILYVTRHFNHSGYIILQRLIAEKIPIEAILLHEDNDRWRQPILKSILKLFYNLKCWYYKCEPLKNLESEEVLAKKNNIPIIWTSSIKSDYFFAELQKVNPDLIVLGGGWHELIPSRVFSFPRYGCINTHPSLLPEFRGTSITRWQVLSGVKKSGSTIHYVDDTFDTGGVLAQKAIDVPNNLTPQQLFSDLGIVGADIMVSLLKKFKTQGKQSTYNVDQNPMYYGYYKRWEWNLEKLKINWEKSFSEIHFHVLACTQESYHYLGTHFKYRNKTFFIRKTSLIELLDKHKKFAEELADNSLYIYSIKEDKICLVKKEESFCLVLEVIQQYDSYYKYRRAYAANKLLKLKTNTKFEYGE